MYYVTYVFNYVVLDISIIPPRHTRLKQDANTQD
jgi:hypothetical protein